MLFSIIATYSMNIILSLYKKSNNTTSIINGNLVLETTRLFLIKQDSLVNLVYNDGILIIDNNLLLDNISNYSKIIDSNHNIYVVNICINNNKNI